MRVLVADQESDMLEAIARVFEVDVATSKATCIDLLRANDFDVLVACERLSDGSVLELLSHVGQRWPGVIRILAMEPERRAMLKGRLGPFKLFETIAYPIDEERLEAVLTRAAEVLARAGGRDVPAATSSNSATIPRPTNPTSATPSRPTSSTRATSKDDARRLGAYKAQGSPAQGVRNAPPLVRGPTTTPAAQRSALPPDSSKRPTAPGQRGPANDRTRPASAPPAYPPLPAKGSKIVPLGSPDTTEYRILPHDYHAQHMPGTLPAHRADDPKKPTLQEKATALAAEAMAAVSEFVRNIKPQSSPRKPAKAPPRKKR
jgi:hypothetical protein